MRILFLDDNPFRQLVMADRFAVKGEDVYAVMSYFDAIDAMRSQPRFDRVYLDYDLADGPIKGSKSWALADFKVGAGSCGCGNPSCGRSPYTGNDVAKWMVSDLPKEKRPKKVIVHSRYGDGAREIALTLFDAGIVVQKVRYEGPDSQAEYDSYLAKRQAAEVAA